MNNSPAGSLVECAMSRNITSFFLCSLLLCVCAFAQDAFAPGSEPSGFRDKQWGDPLSAFAAMNLKESVPGELTLKKIYSESIPSDMPKSLSERSYRSESDFLQIDGVNVDEINYIFHNDKFSGVLIYGRGEETFVQLKKVCLAKYGTAAMSDSSGPIGGYFWQGKKARAELLMAVGGVVILSVASTQ